MIQKEQIDLFFQTPIIAVVGASRNSGKFGNMIYTGLKKLNYQVIPVNPFADEIDGDKCFKSIDELNPLETALVLVTHRNETDKIAELAIQLGFTQIWVQTDCDTQHTPLLAQNKTLNIIFKICILMIMKPKKIERVQKIIDKANMI